MRARLLVVSILFASFLAALMVSPVAAQAKHRFTFEDMMKLKRVGEPVPSPDGKWVLFSVVDVDLAANKKTPYIWIVSLAGGASSEKERVLIADQDGDRPRWSPDGKQFAFISNKEGGSQVWIAEFDGGGNCYRGAQAHLDCHRGWRGALVAGWQEHYFHLRYLS